MLKHLVRLWLLLSCTVLFAQTVALTGNIAYPNGTPFNGTLQISLARASALNTCTSPSSIVRSVPIIVNVVNGAVTGSSSFVPTYCLIPSVPYYVQMYSSTNANIGNSNWYVIPDSTGSMNVSGMVTSNFGGPIVVAVPQPIVANPPGSQTITQPGGTSLIINNLQVTGIATGITASAFSVTPSQCVGANVFSTGIQANGNANCGTIGSGVTTFNGRAGIVVPTSGDYSWSMISGIPNFYYQSMYSVTALQTQRGGLDFSSDFIIGNETSPSANTVALVNTGTPGTYTNPVSITIDAKGRATAVSALANACGSQLGISCTVLPGGLIMEAGQSFSSSVSFTPNFPSICLSVVVTPYDGSAVYSSVNSFSNTGFTITGGSSTFNWIAIGR